MKITKEVKDHKEDIETLKKQVENLNMAVKINQMLLKQVMDNLMPMQTDLKATTGMLNDYQYRFLALQKIFNVDVNALAKTADDLKLKDWEDASLKDDVDQGFTTTDTVESGTDIIIITSKTPTEPEDKGIFRSKTVLADTGNQQLIDGLMNKKIGEIVEVELNGVKHVVTLLGVRRK